MRSYAGPCSEVGDSFFQEIGQYVRGKRFLSKVLYWEERGIPVNLQAAAAIDVARIWKSMPVLTLR